MGRYRYIPRSIKDLAVEQSAHYKASRISTHLSMGRSTVYSTLRRWRQTGSPVARGKRTGRPRNLSGLDLAVSPSSQCQACTETDSFLQYLEGCIEQRPDILADELREQLETARGVKTSNGTISRTLQRAGWTRKKVST